MVLIADMILQFGQERNEDIPGCLNKRPARAHPADRDSSPPGLFPNVDSFLLLCGYGLPGTGGVVAVTMVNSKPVSCLSNKPER